MLFARDSGAPLDGRTPQCLRCRRRISGQRGELFVYGLRRLRIECCFLLIEGRWEVLAREHFSSSGKWQIWKKLCLNTYVPSYSSS